MTDDEAKVGLRVQFTEEWIRKAYPNGVPGLRRIPGKITARSGKLHLVVLVAFDDAPREPVWCQPRNLEPAGPVADSPGRSTA